MRLYPPATIKTPNQSRYATFLFGCVDIFYAHPSAESVSRRPEMRNPDQNFTHKDPNCCPHENVVLRFQAYLVDFEKKGTRSEMS